ncbi:MAG: hypothetical protein ACE5HI_02600 [bacterium]
MQENQPQENQPYDYTQAFLVQRETQRKFDYYLLAVTLALLALSVQTFDPKSNMQFVYLMNATWFALLLSFLSGLYRQEKLNLFFANETIKLRFKPQLDFLKDVQETEKVIYDSQLNAWSPEDIMHEFQNIKEITDLADKRLNKFQIRAYIAYQIQKWSFIIGILSYISFKISNISPGMMNSILNKF